MQGSANPAFAIAGGLGSMGLSLLQADAQSDAISSQQQAARRAANQNMRQTLSQAAARKEEIRRRSHQIQQRTRVLAAERGDAGDSGSTQGVLFRTDIEKSINNRNIDQSAFYTNQAIQTQYQNTVSQLSSAQQNPWLAALLGGAQGALTGLQIGQGIDELFTEPALPVPEADPNLPYIKGYP